jgi:hypothetical protein
MEILQGHGQGGALRQVTLCPPTLIAGPGDGRE